MENTDSASANGLIPRCVDWIDARLKPFWSDYCGRYMRHVRSLHSNCDVYVPGPLGPHRIQLDEAVIPAGVSWRQPTIAWADQNRDLPIELRKGLHSVWEFLNAAPCVARIVLVGEPGSGKTTLLKNIAITLANEAHRDGRERLPRLVPVLLSLPELADRIDTRPDFSLVTAIEESLGGYSRVRPPRGLWKRDIEAGNCLVLLDGFGAISNAEARGRMAFWVQQQMAAYPRSRFIVAARPHEYDSNTLSGSTVVNIGSGPAKNLPSISGTIDALLNWSDAAEPGSKPVARLDPAGKKRVLQTLAYETMQSGRQWMRMEDAGTIVPVEDVRAISRRNGILVDRGQGRLEFTYRPYQEYLAAEHIVQNGRIGELSLRLGDCWWQETMRFACALTGDALTVLQPSLTVDDLSPDTVAMAQECIEAVGGAPETTSERLEQFLDRAETRIDLEGGTTEERRSSAERRLALRLRRMRRIDDDRAASRNLITNAEYQLFVDDQLALGCHCQPDHWVGMQFPEGSGSRPVGGVRPEDADTFGEWLTRRDGQDLRFRSPTIAELRRDDVGDLITNGEGFAFWALSGDNWSCRQAARELPVLTLDALRRCMAEDRVLAEQMDGISQRVCEIERAIDIPLEEALLRAQGRPIVLQPAVARENVKSLDLLLERAYQLARFMDHSKAVDEVKDRNRLARDRARAGELGRALPLAIEQVLDRRPVHGRDRSRERALARATTLALATVLTDLWEHLPAVRNDEMQELAGMLERQRAGFLDLYVALVTLEERIHGRLAAFESILVIADRARAAAVVTSELAKAELLAA